MNIMELVALILITFWLINRPLKTILFGLALLVVTFYGLQLGLRMEQRNSHRTGTECRQKLVDVRVGDLPNVVHCLKGK